MTNTEADAITKSARYQKASIEVLLEDPEMPHFFMKNYCSGMTEDQMKAKLNKRLAELKKLEAVDQQ